LKRDSRGNERERERERERESFAGRKEAAGGGERDAARETPNRCGVRHEALGDLCSNGSV
jgi:hypothetical protein